MRIKAFSAIWWLLRVPRRDLLLDPFPLGSALPRWTRHSRDPGCGLCRAPAPALMARGRTSFSAATLLLALLKMNDKKHLSPGQA